MSRVDPEHKGYISYHRFLEIFEKKESKVKAYYIYICQFQEFQKLKILCVTV